MKFNIIILLVLSVFFQSCKEEINISNSINHLKKFSKIKEQIFDLDTLSFSEINGENGTRIYFIKNDFEVKKGAKVKVILKEYFDFKDLVYSNINTVTNKGELLESSGVIYLRFQSNNKKINLKKNKFIQIKLPKEQLKESQIFYAKIDSLNQFEWEKNKLEYTKINRKLNVGGGITIEKEYLVPLDSVSFYNEKWKKEITDYQNSIDIINKRNNYVSRLLSGNFEFVNFDTFIKSGVRSIDFEVEIEGKSIEQLTFYVLYKNRKSFVSLFKTIDNLNFKKIPFIENETSLLVIGNKDGKLLSDIIVIKENSKEKLKIHLKKYDKTQIEILLKR